MYVGGAIVSAGWPETRMGKGIPLIRQVRGMFLHCACPRIQGFLQLIFEPAVCGLFFCPVSLLPQYPWVCPDGAQHFRGLH